MRSTSLIMREGVNCLLERLGTVETEVFISNLNHDHFDYTEWRRDNLFADMSVEELNQKAALFAKEHHKAVKSQS